ncbi:putative galacturonosyltransferase 12 [Hibiscus syriacus]|uniref:Hexosyltransferase n=1 Tax=Hibiscus syriacus TaxID=106335 RepID=A0A6A2ZNW8_HIBSY|nr:putative galacturonosyltransferase 12 [Hibiscus syriacus]
MQLHVSPSLRHATVMPGKGVREFIKVRVGPRWASYRMLFYSLLFFAFLVRFTFVLSTVDAIDGDQSKCSTIGCLGKRRGPKILGRRFQSHVPEVIYRKLEEAVKEDEVQGKADIPQTLQDFMAGIKESRSDAKSFALKLREMETSSSIPKQLHCLALKLANERSSNAAAGLQLPSAKLVPALVEQLILPLRLGARHFTDRKTYALMRAWFSLHPLLLLSLRSRHCINSNGFRKGRSPFWKPWRKINDLNKVVFLDDDIVIQTDLSPLWDVDMNGKVNGAVETCRGEDSFVMSKRFKSYLNFSHHLVANSFDPNECASAYGMNIFDLEAWRKSNITRTYYHWLELNLKSDLSLWQLGTLPPGLISFRSQVRVIDPFWHMLGLGYQDNTTLSDAETAGVIHFNGRAKPWLDIAFPQLRPLWAK